MHRGASLCKFPVGPAQEALVGCREGSLGAQNEMYKPGMSVSFVARQEGVSASLLFTWRRLDREGGQVVVSAGEAVVSASELAAVRAEIAKRQRVLDTRPWRMRFLRRPWSLPL